MLVPRPAGPPTVRLGPRPLELRRARWHADPAVTTSLPSQPLSMRRLLRASAAVSIGVGILRGSMQLAMSPRSPYNALYLYVTTIGVSLFWTPVALWIAASWRWTGGRARLFAVHAAALVVVSIGEPAWLQCILWMLRPGAPRIVYTASFLGRLDTNLLFYAAIAGALWALDNARRHTAGRVAAAKLETMLADARLHVLTLQLHPHFLFNTLNLISQLAYRDLAAARRTLANLRALLVQSLAHAGHRDVALRDELRFLGAYLEIQQRRFGERLRVNVDVTTDALNAAVPHLVLQPLVENAIAHGIGERANGGEIRIRGRVTGDRLVLSVEDDGIGPRTQPVREGMGLTNTRLRLHQISNGDYRFSFARRAGGNGAEVAIVIPFQAASVAMPVEDGASAFVETTAEPLQRSGRARRSRAWFAAQLLGGWAAVAMIWTEIDSVSRMAQHEPLAWGSSLLASSIPAAIWAVLTPLVLWFSQRFDLVERRSPGRLLAHVGGAALTTALHVAAFLIVQHLVVTRPFRTELTYALGWAIWDVVAYVTILSFSTVATFGARRRESRAAMAMTRARLARTRLASLRLHLQPGVLLAGLDAIDADMATDPERAERAITRMGDLLRLLLARADRDTVSLSSELAVLRAYLDVVGSDATIDTDDGLDDAALPAVLLPPLAASLRAVSAVSVRHHGGELWFELRSRDARVDDVRLAQVRERLHACFDHAWALEVRHECDTVVEMRLPLLRRPDAADDAAGVAETLEVA
jgi:two-component system, LytTR family, sensor kinase